MASIFERAVHILNTRDGGRGIHELLDHLDNHYDILSLRATSRTFKSLRQIDTKAFEKIYVHAPAQEGQHLGALAIIAPLCRSLVVKIAYPQIHKADDWVSRNAAITRAERRRALREALDSRALRRVQDDHVHERRHEYPSTACSTFDIAASSSKPRTPKQKTSGPVAWKFVVQRRPTELNKKLLHLWYILLERFLNITAVTIACNGDPGWPGCTDIEMCLINLRICIERLNFKYLRTISLKPIHAMGIMHLRWAGLGAYGEAPSTSTVHPAFKRRLEPGGLVWQRLDCLQLQVRNPYLEERLTKTQIEEFDKVFADYLRSFKNTLKVLKLEWIDGGNGPDVSPSLAQNFEYGDGTQPWTNLEEVWLANMTVDRIFLAKLEITAPVLRKVMVLGPQSDGAGGEMRGSVGASSLVWRDVLRVQTRAASRAESDAPSDTSRSVQIMLDL